ncbi:acyl-CoA thioesterase [Rhodospira trueperi]|uniref:Acyl-CoA thioesterase YciA n=1 Tax=Rhodospira trueperi TaxID=69960 RepID=A0A1G6Y037_9PROT|nr:acyl-CoA thioesterase [Rhodospira trueperi]SDD83077.1 acyl-CoA thioesterase YciA [Rhodospira trueperi]
MSDQERPNGIVSIRTIAMPADTNPHGDIFGGWVMSQMDLAGGSHARALAQGRVATIAVDGFTFHRPIAVGDEVTCYTRLLKVGRTSLTLKVEAWARRAEDNTCEKVTEGTFVFVALDGDGRSRSVPEGAEARETVLLNGP